MFSVLNIITILKADLSSFNIKFKNCYSLLAKTTRVSGWEINHRGLYNERLPGWSVTLLSGFTRFSNFTNERHTSTTQALRDISLHISKYCTPQKSGFDYFMWVSVLCFTEWSQSNMLAKIQTICLTKRTLLLIKASIWHKRHKINQPVMETNEHSVWNWSL